MSELLLEILSVSLPMTALILLLWLLSRLLGGRFTAKCRYIVWTLIFIRLCLPVGMIDLPSLVQVNLTAETGTELPEIPAKTVIPEEVFSEETVTKPGKTEVFVPSTEPEPVESPVWEAEPELVEAPSVTVSENLPATPPETIPEKHPPTPEPSPVDADADKDVPFPFLTLLGIVWLTGALLYLAVHLISYNLYVRHIRRTCRDVPANILRIHRRLCKTYGIRRVPDVKISRDIHSPLLCGYFRPCVLLPDMTFSPGQAVSVLAHELTHRRRYDLWIKLACVLGCALHWFNPAVHLAAARCCDELELSCDEAVLAGMDEETRRSYGKVMLDLVRYGSRRDRHTVLTTQFHPKKRAVRERFLNIMDMSKKKRGLAVILTAAALCTLAGMVFAYEAEPPADGENYIKINDNVSIRIGFGGLRPLLPPETEEDPAKTEEKTEPTVDVPYEFGGLTFTLPEEFADLVDITESQWTSGLFDVTHKATVEAGAPGWLYSVCRHTYDELVRDDVNHGGIRYFAATPDNTAFYYLLAPTDVQFDPSDEESSEEYGHLSDRWKTLTNDIIAKNGLTPFDSSNIPDIRHLTPDLSIYPSYAPAVYPVRLEYDETHGWLLRGDGAGPDGISLGDSLKDADIYAEWVTETCCRIAADGEVYDLYRNDAVWAFEPSDFGFAWENNLPVWTMSESLTAATESDLLRRIAYERMNLQEFRSLTTVQSAFVRELSALVEPYRPESPDTATVHGDPYYVPDGVVFPETVKWHTLHIRRNPEKLQEWTVEWKVGEMMLYTTATVERENDTYRLALTEPEFQLLKSIRAEEGDLRPVLEALMTDPRTDYLVDVVVAGTDNARLTLEISGEGRDLHQLKKVRLRQMKAKGQTLTFDEPFDLWTVGAVHVFGADGAVVLDRLPTGYAGTTFLFTSRDIYEYNPGVSFSMVLYEENDDLRYRHSSNLLNPQAENVLGNATARDNFSYECGDVKLSGGRPQFYAADEYYTVADVFELDADFATYWKSDAYPTLDALLLYNAERYRDMNDYPTPDETPLPAVYSDKNTVPRLPLTGHDVPTYFNKDAAYTETDTAYTLRIETENAAGKELMTSIDIPQLPGTSATIEGWNREMYELIRDHYAFLVYDYEKNDINNYYVNISYRQSETDGVVSIILLFEESTCMEKTVTTVRHAQVFHYDTVKDVFLSNKEYLARLTNGTMTMQFLLDRLNEQNTRYVLNGSDEPYTMSELYGVLPSAWNDGGIDVILPIADRSAGLGKVTEDNVTTVLHYVPGKTYPTYTVDDDFTATYRLVRQFDFYRIFCNIVDKRDLPIAEDNQSKRRIISSRITEDYAIDFRKDEYFGVSDTFIAHLTYTDEHGRSAERMVSFTDFLNAEAYFRMYLEGKYDMDTLMKHTRMVPVRVWNETNAILDAYRNGELPYDGAPAFPENCTVPKMRLTEEILELHQDSGEENYPFKVEFPLENGQTMRILWNVTDLGENEYEITQRVVFLP